MHPSLRILALILMATAIQFMSAAAIVALGGVIGGLAFYLHVGLLRKLLYRSRWLLLTLLLIYAFTTPGEYVAGWGFDLAPTYEGIQHGLLQAGRLALMLAGLALLLGTTPRNALMAGIFQLLRPLRLAGVSPERFTARLWLTLHYVEQDARPADKASFWSRLDDVAQHTAAAEVQSIRFALPALSRLDWFIICGAGAALAGWLA